MRIQGMTCLAEKLGPSRYILVRIPVSDGVMVARETAGNVNINTNSAWQLRSASIYYIDAQLTTW